MNKGDDVDHGSERMLTYPRGGKMSAWSRWRRETAREADSKIWGGIWWVAGPSTGK